MHDDIDILVKRGSATARDGFSNEDDVIKKFNNWEKDPDAQKWLKIMKYNLEEIEKVEAIKIKGSFKTDVQVKIKIYLKNVIVAENISIKLVSRTQGFNQIDKRKVEKYTELWAIPEDVKSMLKLFVGETSPEITNPKDARRMFLTEFTHEDQTVIKKFFEANKILVVSDIFKGRELLAASWMLIYLKDSNIWSFLPMSVVMNYYGSGPVRITALGSLKIGKITMQRKGGDAGRESAKMLQFKINPSDIVHSFLSSEKK